MLSTRLVQTSRRPGWNIQRAVWPARICKMVQPGSNATACSQMSSNAQRDDEYDVIVVGVGAFGSAALYHMSKLGIKALGLDARPPGHNMGSSHGETRIIRLAYFEGAEYVPLIRRSLDLFEDLERQTGEEFFYKTGVVDLGGSFPGALLSAQRHNLVHEVLSGEELNRRFPGYAVPPDSKALYQPEGGLLTPEKIIQAHCSLAASHGAVFMTGEGYGVDEWRIAPSNSNPSPSSRSSSPSPSPSSSSSSSSSSSTSVEVRTTGGQTFKARQMILSPGAWMGKLVPESKPLCIPIRQVVGWFDYPGGEQLFQKERFPVFIVGTDNEFWYGFPEYGTQRGLKIGLYNHLREIVEPDEMKRGLTAADEMALRRGVQHFFGPAAEGKLLNYSECMFTNTPDNHFIIDRHPSHPEVVLCSACSGHGFKMSSGIGELLANMCAGGPGSPGDSTIQEELRLHRIQPGVREGHNEFVEKCLKTS